MGMGEAGMFPEDGQETLALARAGIQRMAQWKAEEELEKAFLNRCETRKEQYEFNRQARVGTKIKCAYCGKDMTKKSYQQKFCRTRCKDRYHNSVPEHRRGRTEHNLRLRKK